jgi:hypothetical protein
VTPLLQPQESVDDTGIYEPVSPLSEDNLDADHDGVPLKLRYVSSIIGQVEVPGRAVRNVEQDHLYSVNADEPTSFQAAEQDPQWQATMKEELKAIEDNHTRVMVDLPPDRKAIGLKWVFKVKKDEQRSVVKHKARLVVKGYSQRHGMDYDEVFTPVARLETVRMLLALAAHQDWEVHHMDVKSAFLNGDLVEEVFVLHPPGFVVTGRENQVLKLKKALYGLHQAPRA